MFIPSLLNAGLLAGTVSLFFIAFHDTSLVLIRSEMLIFFPKHPTATTGQ